MSFVLGKGSLDRLTIRSTRGKAETNLSSLATMITFYEDMFTPFMSCDVQITDGASLRTQTEAGIIGGELVSVDMGDGGGGRKLKSDFFVRDITNITKIKPDVETYTLRLTALHDLYDAPTTLNGSYTGEIEKSIEKVITEFITPKTKKKLITKEASQGIQSIIASQITPLAFIKQLTREAQSKTNPSSLYFFYETVEGYHFITIDELFSKSVPNTHKFIHDELSTSQYSPGASGRLSTNILNLQIDETPSIGSLQDQGVSSQTYSLDTLTRKRTIIENYYDESFKGAKGDNPNFPTATSKQFFGNSKGKLSDKGGTAQHYIIGSNPNTLPYVSNRDPSMDTTFRHRQSFAAIETMTKALYGARRKHISIYGNPNIKPGDTIDLALPMTTSSNEKNKNNPDDSGKHIATAVKHVIQMAEGKYETVIECMKRGSDKPIDKY